MKNFDKISMPGMPIQAEPVERQICGAVFSGDAGVEASGIFGALLGAAKVIAPIALRLL